MSRQEKRQRRLEDAAEQWVGGIEWTLDTEGHQIDGDLPRWAGIATDGRHLGVTVADDRAAVVQSMANDVTNTDAGCWVPLALVDLDKKNDRREIFAAVTIADPWAAPSGVEARCELTGLRISTHRRDAEHGAEACVQIDTDEQAEPLGPLGPKLAVFLNDSDLYDGTDYGLAHPSRSDVVTVPAPLAGYLAETLRDYRGDKQAALDALLDAIGGRARAEVLADLYDQ